MLLIAGMIIGMYMLPVAFCRNDYSYVYIYIYILPIACCRNDYSYVYIAYCLLQEWLSLCIYCLLHFAGLTILSSYVYIYIYCPLPNAGMTIAMYIERERYGLLPVTWMTIAIYILPFAFRRNGYRYVYIASCLLQEWL